MKRDYEKTISDFNKMFEGRAYYPIFASDLENIRDNNDNIFDIVVNAIKYGYIMGYKAAKNAAKR